MVKLVGLFAGIGGIEQGLRAGYGPDLEAVLLSEWWAPAQAVLTKHFQNTDLRGDVSDLRALPVDLDLLTAGFPCTDLSQAGRTAGISGTASSMVAHVFRLLRQRQATGGHLPDLLVENVPNMLSLDRGRAMSYLVHELEVLGYRWAYRTVDSRFTGLPQRRRRVILLASTQLDPAQVLFADAGEARPQSDYAPTAFGFYWTEGNRGIGWAQDAVPTLKGSSTVGIPSPPAVWVPGAAVPFVVPAITDAEALQGLPRGWTDVTFDGLTSARSLGTRWKLVGNAVTTRVAEWVGSRWKEPGAVAVASTVFRKGDRWPAAAWGHNGQVWHAHASEFPLCRPYEHLLDVAPAERSTRLSDRALHGFTSRLQRSNLRTYDGFLAALQGECAERDLSSQLRQTRADIPGRGSRTGSSLPAA